MRIAKTRKTYLLSPFSSGDTTLTLKDFVTHKGVPHVIASFNNLLVVTIRQGNTIEMVLCNNIVQNASGSATLTVAPNGRNLLAIFPYTGGAVGEDFGSGAEVVNGDDPYTVYQITIAYTNAVALAGAPDAALTVKGVLQAATLAQVRARTANGSTGAKLAATPDVLTDMPTEEQKAALAGGATFGTPGDGNKFATEEFLVTKTVNTQTFNASGTFTKPVGFTWALVEAWGAGASGGASADTSNLHDASAGAGGEYVAAMFPLSLFAATETVTIGVGGAAVVAVTEAAVNGIAGGATTLGTRLTANGGAPGVGRKDSAAGAAPNTVGGTAGTSTFNTLRTENGGFGGGANCNTGSSTSGESRTFAAGGGGGARGAGGGSAGASAGGTSVGGGNGGAGNATASTGNIAATAGAAPGGGGGACTGQGGTITSGAGAAGRLRITCF